MLVFLYQVIYASFLVVYKKNSTKATQNLMRFWRVKY